MDEQIKELIDYLRHGEKPGYWSLTTNRGWADAVEELQENLHEAKIENTINISKVEAYEKILDKGITVNVYQDRVETTGIPLRDTKGNVYIPDEYGNYGLGDTAEKPVPFNETAFRSKANNYPEIRCLECGETIPFADVDEHEIDHDNRGKSEKEKTE